MLALTIVTGALVGGGDGQDASVAAGTADGADVVVAQSSFGAVRLPDVVAQTTSTLLASSTAETTTSTTTPEAGDDAEVRSSDADASAADTDSTTSSSSTSGAPTTTAAPPTTQAPTTTAAPPTTQAPTTTAAPAESSDDEQRSGGDGGYAYDDPRSTQVWLDLAQCESGGNWSIDSGNGYYGGLQFSEASWEGVGGTGYPHEHPRDTQIEMGRRLQARQGWGAWPHCSEELGLH